MKPIEVYVRAWEICTERGFGWESELVRKMDFSKTTAEDLLREFVWVVVNSGMKNQVAERIFKDFMADLNPAKIRHPLKRRAIEDALAKHRDWFEGLKAAPDKLAFLDSLPHIGPVTKFHLARNLGLDVAKPDRHLVRLAGLLGFPDVQAMCEAISKQVGERVGVVDVVLWRAANLVPGFPEG